ncbi:MAG: aminopeptidase P family protein [Ruminococcus sp.]|nr:aminopeptidase P family protein [Ruminococcus sp.]
MDNLERLQRRISKIADCGIINDQVNRRYFTGMKSSAGTLLVFPEESIFIIDFRYIEKAKKTVKNCQVVLEEFPLSAQIKKIFQDRGVRTAAIDAMTCTVSQLESFDKSLGVQLVADEGFAWLIRELRMIKTPQETDKMIKAQRIAEQGFEHMLDYIRPGRTEREIQLELDFFMLSHGAEALSFDTIALSGKNTSLPHGVPSDKQVQSGEFVLMDFGAVFEGYHSDMTRTVCVGQPSDEMKRVYDIVLRAQQTALSQLKAGISGKALDKIARDIIASEGFGDNFGHSLGHGVGMEIHEQPYSSPSREDILPENCVITVEPGIYIEDKFGVRIEDFAVVQSDGCLNMTLAPKELIIL